MGAATLAGEDRSDPSRSVAEAAALEAALRAGLNRRRDGARVEAGRRISLRQRYRRLLRVDACASFTLARFRLDRRTGLRLAAAMGRLHDDAIRTQSRTRRPPCGLSAVPEDRLTGALIAVIPGHRAAMNFDVQLHIGESRDSGSDAEPVIGPRFARTRWHRPGMTSCYSRRLAGLPETHHPLGRRRHQASEIHP